MLHRTPPAVVVLLLASLAGAAPVVAQDAPRLIVPTLASADAKLGQKLGDELRSELDDITDDKELDVVDKRTLTQALSSSGIPFETALIPALARQLTRSLRGDEFVNGTVERTSSGVRAQVTLTLQRDERLVQPIPPAEGRDVDAVAGQLAREIKQARTQLPFERQCVSAAREHRYADAVQAARAGVRAYPRGVIARICLLTASAALEAPADTLAAMAEEILAIAPANTIALDMGAQMYGTLGRADRAAELWQRLLAAAPEDAGTVERVVRGLAALGNFEIARPVIVKAVEEHPDNIQLLKLKWLMLLNAREWNDAIASGTRIEQSAPILADTDFYARMASAYRAAEKPREALQTIARGVEKFPESGMLYALYAQYVREEGDNAVQRGLQKFPNEPRLYLLEAQRLLANEEVEGALHALDRAVQLDSTTVGALVRVAQLRSQLGQDDSAVVALKAALRHGADSALVAQVALARGNALYRDASARKDRPGLQRALGFLQLAEGVRPSPQASLLKGLSSLSLSQSAATEAPATKSCELARLAQSSLADAQIALPEGGRIAPDAVAKSLEYAVQLAPVVEQQVKAFCAPAD
ncbi:MAG TPA: hypothetical protein VFK13_05830 [Gemmatimonadaceae bacterium]|nr:hypothetical protein [Gemmatimonadaceae bacterium]